jgi:hypothetical protein
VPVIELLVELLACHAHLLGIHDDDEVAGVDMRRVGGLVLAAEGVGNLRRQPPEGLRLGVDHVPVALDLAGLCGVGLHERPGTIDERASGRRHRLVARASGLLPFGHAGGAL